MKRPDWLHKLGAREEKQRAAHGLTPKRDGWYKSIDGKTRYICRPCTVAAAIDVLPSRVAAIRDKARGVRSVARAVAGSLTINGLAGLYVDWLYERLTTGRPKRLSRRTYDDNVTVIAKFVEACGAGKIADLVGPADFTAYSRRHFVSRAASSIRREIIYIEAFANWAAPGSRKAGHLSRPWFFGTDFTKPTDDQIGAAAGDSDKAYSPGELRGALLRVKDSPMLRAAGWLGLNCAFGPKDVAELPESSIDWKESIIRFRRGKTGVSRLCVLWPCTLIALRKYMTGRGAACDASAAGLVFRTSNGLPYARSRADDDAREKPATWHDGVGNRWHKVTGLPFSGLRSTFATAADDWTDQRAVDLVLGHKRRDIRREHYAKRVDPERIRALMAHVWAGVFGRDGK